MISSFEHRQRILLADIEARRVRDAQDAESKAKHLAKTIQREQVKLARADTARTQKIAEVKAQNLVRTQLARAEVESKVTDWVASPELIRSRLR